MANVISQEDYKVIAQLYSDAKDLISNTSGYLFDAVYEIVLFQQVIPEVDLVNPFWNAYLQNSDTAAIPDNFIFAVTTLNRHVLNRSSFSTIDDYLGATAPITQVPRSWADMSAAAGFTISETYIDDSLNISGCIESCS